jgi:gamma-glutamylcyclotransferase (GGCT)/AIG2-like uncharacterized protein YtfP
MPLLFSYGSLREPRVQLATFGRLLSGQPDALVGFEQERVHRAGKQLANVIRSGRNDSRVPGMAFEVGEAELLAADEYERADDYARIAVSLASGVHAWVYVDRCSGGPGR